MTPFDTTPLQFDPVFRWQFDSEDVYVNGSIVEITFDERVNELVMIGGRTLRVYAAWGDTPRTKGRATIHTEFPPLNREQMEELWLYREFGQEFLLSLRLLDPLEPIVCTRDALAVTDATAPVFYLPHRGLEVGSAAVYQRSTSDPYAAWTEVANTGGTAWTEDPDAGTVTFNAPVASTIEVGATYRWSPRVAIFEIASNDMAGLSEPLFKPKVTFREVA